MIELKTVIPGQLVVSGQPQVDDIAELAKRGYKTLISNRPDTESPGQPDAELLQSAAKQHGMHFVHIPIGLDGIARSDVDAFRESLQKNPSPVFAHCGTGKRSYLLWAAGQVLYDGRSVDELLEQGTALGFDVSVLPQLLDRLSSP